MKKTILMISLMAFAASAKDPQWPAARIHVKLVEGGAVKYTSRLRKVVDLNFTMAVGHQSGKEVIAASLDRMARNFGFSVRHITSSNKGSVSGKIPEFTFEDLVSGDVIVANNISAFDGVLLGAPKREAIQRAIETEGRGYLGFHGSGDSFGSRSSSSQGWKWFEEELFPLDFAGHSARVAVPVYKHLEESRHIVLEGVLDSGATLAPSVPNELDGFGNEVLATGVPVRAVKNEMWRFNRDISRDPLYRQRVTILLKFDPRALESDGWINPFKRKGGNVYTFLYQVGRGMTSYIPAGHENDELMDPASGLDGGVGDFDRYVAQTLYFLAGYDSMACDHSCNNLPLVDTGNRLTGNAYNVTSVAGTLGKAFHFHQGGMGFSFPFQAGFSAQVTDMMSREIFSRKGTGPTSIAFDASKLGQGIYFLRVRTGSAPARVKRYAVLASSP